MAAANIVSRVVQDPLDAPRMGPDMIHGPKDDVAAPEQILDVNLCRRFPSTPDEFGPETGYIGSFLQLSFHPYKEHPNPTLYATWASVLVRAVTGVRN
jgi:hypothetical protein